VSFAGNKLTLNAVLENLNILDYDYFFRIVENGFKEDIPACLLLFNDIQEKGFDGHNFIVGLADHYRNLLVCKDVRTAQLLEVGESVESRFIDQAKLLESAYILRALGVLSKTDVEYKASKNQRLLVELALMQLCSIKNELEKKKD
jgi:DNA polymerase-3 subunit gamma/tau